VGLFFSHPRTRRHFASAPLVCGKNSVQVFLSFLTNKGRRKNAPCATREFFRFYISTTPNPRQSWRGLKLCSECRNKIFTNARRLCFLSIIFPWCKKHVSSNLLKFFSARELEELTPLQSWSFQEKSVLRCPEEPRPKKIVTTARHLQFSGRGRPAKLRSSQIAPIFLAS